jgi:hypothetical protein
MRVSIEEVEAGQHPSEKVVKIHTVDGPVHLIVDHRSIQQQSLDVGFPVAQHDDKFLIELPRESIRGVWRVWVDKAIVVA